MSDDFGFSQMQNIQKELQDKYKDKWEKLTPCEGKNKLFYMMIECAEAADIIKKEGVLQIAENPEIRKRFIEEMCDVMMYYNDILLCYDISVEELKEIYLKKHHRNMNRW